MLHGAHEQGRARRNAGQACHKRPGRKRLRRDDAGTLLLRSHLLLLDVGRDGAGFVKSRLFVVAPCQQSRVSARPPPRPHALSLRALAACFTFSLSLST
eukprot:6206218-Pleurochrysis_carterae.AAC.1